MSRHPISLAAGIMPEATPEQLVEAAAAARFDYGGMWVEKGKWDAGTTPRIRKMLGDAGVTLLDVEVVWIMPGAPDPWLSEVIDIAAELGAANVLCVSSDPSPQETADKLQVLVDRAAGTGVRVNLEYGLFTAVRSIGEARAIVERLEGDNKGLLVDTLHWHRCGGTGADIEALPREWIGYAQLCDAPAEGPDLSNMDSIIDDAINKRTALGAGGLPIAEMVDALPEGLPVAIEERSQSLREAFPDLNERARQVAKTTRAWLADYETRAR